jgi:hypothetical protein
MLIVARLLARARDCERKSKNGGSEHRGNLLASTGNVQVSNQIRRPRLSGL